MVLLLRTRRHWKTSDSAEGGQSGKASWRRWYWGQRGFGDESLGSEGAPGQGQGQEREGGICGGAWQTSLVENGHLWLQGGALGGQKDANREIWNQTD